MQAVRNNKRVVAKYNVHHHAGHRQSPLNIVSANVGYSESLLADYAGRYDSYYGNPAGFLSVSTTTHLIC